LRAAGVLLLLAALAACGGGGGDAPGAQGSVFKTAFSSQNTGALYQVDIYVPAGYASDTAATYPTIYVTEAEALSRFATFQGIMERRGTRAILVGVSGAALRSRDFLLPGATAYHAFLTKELMPWVDARYRTSNRRALTGLSWGGTFVMTAFYLEAVAGQFNFSHFLSAEYANPSTESADALAALKSAALQPGRTVPGITVHLAGADPTVGINNSDLVRAFHAELQARSLPGLTLVHTQHAQTNHVSVDPPAFEEALQRFFP
jgi:predicted alpha/beta superfamily hydrolase